MIWTITQKNALACAPCSSSASSRLDFAVDFVGGLGDQEQSAADQDDVAPGEFQVFHRQHRLRQPDQPDQEAKQKDAEHQRQQQPDLPRAFACGCGIRDTMIDRKMTLSMPSTISSAVNVSSAAQASALVRSSIMPSLTPWTF